MINTNYCMNCMRELSEDVTVCPHCSYDNNSEQSAPMLKKGSIVFGRYLVGKMQTVASDSITYIGRNTESNETVSIIEFYPQNIVTRSTDGDDICVKVGYEAVFKDYLQSFLRLWESLGEFKGRICLPQVIDIVDFNGTVYTITRYKDCITLKHYFESKTPLPWKKARSAFRPVIEAVALLNEKGIVHGAISPESVCVGSDGKLHITGFSIPECYKGAVELKSAPIYGFAPLECYSLPPVLNEKVDVYSVTALLYYAITGIVPSEALQRAVKDDMVMPSAVAKTLAKNEIAIFVKGLSLRANNRIITVSKLYELLYTVARTADVPTKQPVQEVKKSPQKVAKKTVQNKKEQEADDSDDIKSMIPLMVKTFITAVVVCTMIFISLYSTSLYKKIDIPVFDKILSPFTFLPVNKNDDIIDIPETDDSTRPPVQTTGSNDRAYVTVPDFTSKTYESIKSSSVYNKNFKIVFEFEDSKKYEKNSVISQSLTAGESVLVGTEVTIVISSGYKQVELPDVIGMDYQAAKEKLEHKGFKVKKLLTQNDGKQIPGEVYMMNKVAGLEFDEGTEIELSVWDEIKPKETTAKQN